MIFWVNREKENFAVLFYICVKIWLYHDRVNHKDNWLEHRDIDTAAIIANALLFPSSPIALPFPQPLFLFMSPSHIHSATHTCTYWDIQILISLEFESLEVLTSERMAKVI